MQAPTTKLPNGIDMPVLGQGTWRMGEDRLRRKAEVAALQLGLDLGMLLIDTAEMYGDAELVVGEAIRGRREQVFVTSKVLPSNASRTGVMHAAERSLARLGTDYMDMYLLHWEGRYPLEDTLAGLLDLQKQGKIRAFGVSNFDADALARARALPGGDQLAANQILYNLTRRGAEPRVIPLCQDAGMAVMAYSPLEQARMDWDGVLARVARRHDATPAQIAIAWTLRLPSVVSIPKAVTEKHVRDNAGAIDVHLTDEDIADLDRAFPAGEEGLAYL